ncbi:tungstate transporter permease, partial [bacterium]|nr:tungstate transporter permease [bacterium]
MEVLWNAIVDAARLLFSFDLGTYEIIFLSLRTSGLSVLIAMAFGIPIGYLIGSRRFLGRNFVMIIVNTGMGLPPVVVGLIVY